MPSCHWFSSMPMFVSWSHKKRLDWVLLTVCITEMTPYHLCFPLVRSESVIPLILKGGHYTMKQRWGGSWVLKYLTVMVYYQVLLALSLKSDLNLELSVVACACHQSQNLGCRGRKTVILRLLYRYIQRSYLKNKRTNKNLTTLTPSAASMSRKGKIKLVKMISLSVVNTRYL